MKIEDIKYALPTAQVDGENFDKEKWLQKNPIDYFKFLYILFTSNKIAPQMPSSLTMQIAFEKLYKVIRLYIPNTLYKFYSLTYDEELNKKKLLTLKNKQIYMSDIKDFNDPFDGKAFFYNPDKLKNIDRLVPHNGRFIEDFTAFHKATALTKNDMNCMPMWAHYSNNHEGFCVAYNMNEKGNLALSSCTFPIQYTDQRLDVTSYMKKYASMLSKEVDKQLAQGNKQTIIKDLSIVYMALYLCNIKHPSWQYENEFRCTMGAESRGMPYVNAIPQAIYIGMKCNSENSKKLMEIANYLSIPIYQMKFNELSENYSLEPKLLEI